MITPLLNHLQKTAGEFAFHSPLYNWSLRGEVPERLAVKPVDVWPGDPEAGRALCEETFPQLGWAALPSAMHDFTWLRHMPAFAYKAGQHEAVRALTRSVIANWAARYEGWSQEIWRSDMLGVRLSMWISHYEFFSEDEGFDEVFFDSLARQAKHLSRALSASELTGGIHGVALFKAAKGLLYAGLALEGKNAWASQALEIFETEIHRQILGDGAHVSRAPNQLLDALQILLDVRSALCTAGLPVPENLQHAIDRAGPALRVFRHHDQKFASFNGAQEGDKANIDTVLAQTGAKGKTLNTLPCAGFERVQVGRTLLFMDCGAPPARPFDVAHHAAPLSFEMSYAKERIFVNCGSHPDDAVWQDALRGTAAHNTLTLDHRNACEIAAGRHFGRKPRAVKTAREDSKHGHLLDASHDSYTPLNSMTHRRRLYLCASGHDLRGEDTLHAGAAPVRPIEAALRFHLHPSVRVSLIGDGGEALLRTPSGMGWRFKYEGGILKQEDSLYLGQGCTPRKTKQLVITGHITEAVAQIKWRFSKEG